MRLSFSTPGGGGSAGNLDHKKGSMVRKVWGVSRFKERGSFMNEVSIIKSSLLILFSKQKINCQTFLHMIMSYLVCRLVVKLGVC